MAESSDKNIGALFQDEQNSSPKRSTNKHQSDSDRRRSSRRKPAKTCKVAADVDEDSVTGFDDYLKEGIPDVLLKGLGFTETDQHSRSNSPQWEGDDDDQLVVDNDTSTSTATTVVSPNQRLHNPRDNGIASCSITLPIAPVVVCSPPPRRRGRLPSSQAHYQHASVSSSTPVQVSKSSVPASAAAISNLLPITQHNVGQVLDKMLAATQSMGMLLTSLKDDLRRASMPFVSKAADCWVSDMQKKRREAATKLWRAFVAYKKSFEDIEMYTQTTGANLLTSTAPLQSPAPMGVATKQAARQTSSRPAEPKTKVPPLRITTVSNRKGKNAQANVVNVIELSDSDEEVPPTKKQLCDEALGKVVRPTTTAISDKSDDNDKAADGCQPSSLNGGQQGVSAAPDVELAQSSGAEAGNITIEDGTSRLSVQSVVETSHREQVSSITKSKPVLFSSLRFEPLFDIQPVIDSDS